MPRVRSTEPSLHTERIRGLLVAMAVVLDWYAIAERVVARELPQLRARGIKSLQGCKWLRAGQWAKIAGKNYQGKKVKSRSGLRLFTYMRIRWDTPIKRLVVCRGRQIYAACRPPPRCTLR